VRESGQLQFLLGELKIFRGDLAHNQSVSKNTVSRF
jgi:hypothetical protein